MDIDDVITRTVEIMTNSEIRKAMEVGYRLAEIQGLTVDDLEILMKDYANKSYKQIEHILGTALSQHIPGFHKLCPICPGVLDCGSDHQ